MNNCSFTGRLGRDPELRQTPSGQSVCNFSMAVNRYKKDDGALWLDVSVWGKQGENAAKYLAKGSEVGVDGSVDYREFEKRDGSQGFSMMLNAHGVSFIGPRVEREPEAAAAGGDDIFA